MAIRAAITTGTVSYKNMTLVSCGTNTHQPTHALGGGNSTITCRFESLFVMVGGPGKIYSAVQSYYEWCSGRTGEK
jgi:hypothetical protein